MVETQSFSADTEHFKMEKEKRRKTENEKTRKCSHKKNLQKTNEKLVTHQKFSF